MTSNVLIRDINNIIKLFKTFWLLSHVLLFNHEWNFFMHNHLNILYNYTLSKTINVNNV